MPIKLSEPDQVWLKETIFTNRILTLWNSSPAIDYIITSDSVYVFKNYLDNYSRDRDMLYNQKAEVTGIGGRSESVHIAPIEII